MFIQTETTPNPAALKFLPGKVVMAVGTVHLTHAAADADAVRRSPLARRLFAVDGITSVFFGHDFITVTKADTEEWSLLKPALLQALMDHFLSGMPAVEEERPSSESLSRDDAFTDASPLITEIKQILETRVRPAVAMDGGDIIFEDFRDGIVYVRLQGACSGCPSSTVTLKNGIENMLRYYVPEVTAVEQVIDEEEVSHAVHF